MHRVIALGISLLLFCSCGAPEPGIPGVTPAGSVLIDGVPETIGETRSALTNTYDIDNLYSETNFSGGALLSTDINFLAFSFVAPGLPWNPSNGGKFGWIEGAFYTPGNGVIGLNRVFAKCERTGSTYHCQWDLYWGDSAGHQYSAINALYGIAYPGDYVYMSWYGISQGSFSHTAFVSVYRPDGTLRASNSRTDMGFATNLNPNGQMWPSFMFATQDGYSCTDLPAPDDDVSFNGQMAFTSWYGFDGQAPVQGYYALAPGQFYSTSDPHCGLEWAKFPDESSMLYWHAY